MITALLRPIHRPLWVHNLPLMFLEVRFSWLMMHMKERRDWGGFGQAFERRHPIRKLLGREIAKPDEVRQILGLKGIDKVNF